MSATLELRGSTTMRHRSTARRKIIGSRWSSARVDRSPSSASRVMTFVVWEVIVDGAQVWRRRLLHAIDAAGSHVSRPAVSPNAIFGTLVITGVAALLAIPTRVPRAASYLAEFGRSGRWRPRSA